MSHYPQPDRSAHLRPTPRLQMPDQQPNASRQWSKDEQLNLIHQYQSILATLVAHFMDGSVTPEHLDSICERASTTSYMILECKLRKAAHDHEDKGLHEHDPLHQHAGSDGNEGLKAGEVSPTNSPNRPPTSEHPDSAADEEELEEGEIPTTNANGGEQRVLFNEGIATLRWMERMILSGNLDAEWINKFTAVRKAHEERVHDIFAEYIQRHGFCFLGSMKGWQPEGGPFTHKDFEIFDIVEFIQMSLLRHDWLPESPEGTSVEYVEEGWVRRQHRYGVVAAKVRGRHINVMTGRGRGYTIEELIAIPDDEAELLGVLVKRDEALPEGCSQHLTRINTVGHSYERYIVINLYEEGVHDGTPIRKVQGTVTREGRLACREGLLRISEMFWAQSPIVDDVEEFDEDAPDDGGYIGEPYRGDEVVD